MREGNISAATSLHPSLYALQGDYQRGCLVGCSTASTWVDFRDLRDQGGNDPAQHVYNSTEETICLTPKTALVAVRARSITLKQLGKDVRRINSISEEDPNSFGERLREEIMLLYPM